MGIAQPLPSRLVGTRRPLGADIVATVLVAVAVALGLTALSLRIAHLGVADGLLGLSWVVVEVAAALTYGPVGALILRRGGSRPIGWLFVAVATCYALAAFGSEYGAHGTYYVPGSVPAAAAVGSLQSWVWMPGNVLLAALLPHLLPDGRLHDQSSRWAAGAAILGLALIVPAGITNPWPWPIGDPASPLGVPDEAWQTTAQVAATVGGWIALVATVLGLRSLARHRAAAGPHQRPALSWLLFGATAVAIPHVLTVATLPLDSTLLQPLEQLLQLVALPVLPMATLVAVLRHRLWGVEHLVRRGLVAVLLGTGVVVLAAATAWGVTRLVGPGAAGTIVAALVVAGVVQPLRRRIDAAVGDLLHGPGGDPLAVVQRVGAAAQRPPSAAAAAREVLRTLCDDAGLGAARLRDADDLGGAAIATHGVLDDAHAVSVPLQAGGQVVGHLEVAPAAGDRVAERLLTGLDAIAPQLGSLLVAARLQRDLEQSRQRLANATESERRRLRQDLHDGLGPTLAGVALGVHAAGARLETGRTDEARQLLAVLAREVESSVGDVRRIVDGLRPSTLEELGLVGAAREQVSRVGDAGLDATLTLDGVPARLPPAVEVAAFHVLREGIANVLHHAGAERIAVELRGDADRLLVVAVHDDGRGLSAGSGGRTGTGLASLRERVESSGGTFTVGGDHGTTIRASWPVAVAP